MSATSCHDGMERIKRPHGYNGVKEFDHCLPFHNVPFIEFMTFHITDGITLNRQTLPAGSSVVRRQLVWLACT